MFYRKTEDNGSIIKLAILLISALTVVYGVSVTSGIPLADEWRWFKELLIPMESGKITFLSYITGEYALFGHTHFITLLALYLNFAFANLDLQYLSYVGFYFYVAGSLVLLRAANIESKNQTAAVIFALAAYFNPTTDFPWLLVVFEYTYYFGLIVVIALANNLVQKKITIAFWAATCFSSAFLLDSFGAVGVIASIAGFLAVENNNKDKALHILITLIAYFSGWLILYIFLGKGIGTQSTSRIDTILLLLSSPYEFFQSLAISVSQPLIDQTILLHYTKNSATPIQFCIAIIGSCFIIHSLYIAFKSEAPNTLFFPITLIFTAAVAFLLITITRFADFGPTELGARRFTRFYVLYYIGAIIIYAKTNPNKKILITLGVMILISYLHSHWFLEKYKEHVINHFNNISLIIAKNEINRESLEKQLWVCKFSDCVESIYQLRQRNVLWASSSESP